MTGWGLHPAHSALLSLCDIYTAGLWLNPAVLRTALIYLESPCDLGQQICGIRPATLWLCNVSQTASCTSQSAPIQPDSSCTLHYYWCILETRAYNIWWNDVPPAGSECKRPLALEVRYLILPTPEGGLFLMVLFALNFTKQNRTAVVVFDRHFSVQQLF